MFSYLLKLFFSFSVFVSVSSFSQTIEKPKKMDDGWAVSSLEKEGFDIQKFKAVEAYIEAEKQQDLQSVSVFRNNKIVYDNHLNGSDESSITDIRSATKSIVSLLIGIAIDKGMIKSVDEKILPYFSDYEPIQNLDDNKRNVRIRDLLTMTAGFDSDDDVEGSKGNENNLDALSSDWVRYSIDVPMVHQPGEHWAYSSMNTFLLGYVLEQATGDTLNVFADKYLFQPLGIKNVRWRRTPEGRIVAQGNFRISSRDMGKIGQLFLTQGKYKDEHIVSNTWLQQSIEALYPVPWSNIDTYGFKWYNHRLDVGGTQVDYILATGNGGNKIYIAPKLKLVVTITSTAYNQGRGQRRSFEILRRVLASAVSPSETQKTD